MKIYFIICWLDLNIYGTISPRVWRCYFHGCDVLKKDCLFSENSV